MDEQKQTFAEWYFKYLRTHPNCTITLRRDFGFMHDFVLVMQMTDLKNGKSIGAQQVIRNEVFKQSDMTYDEIFIFCAQKLRKELDNYGQ